MPLLGHPSQASLATFLRGAAKLLPSKPKAIVVVTAHWVSQHGLHASFGLAVDYMTLRRTSGPRYPETGAVACIGW